MVQTYNDDDLVYEKLRKTYTEFLGPFLFCCVGHGGFTFFGASPVRVLGSVEWY